MPWNQPRIGETSAPPSEADNQTTQKHPSSGHGLKLILVEDDPFIRETWEIIWQNHPIQTFANPDELFAAIKGTPPIIGPDTVLVTDCLFDNSTLTGADVVSFGRSQNAFKVLLASDYIDPALSALGDGTIGKSPIGPDDLITYLSK